MMDVDGVEYYFKLLSFKRGENFMFDIDFGYFNEKI